MRLGCLSFFLHVHEIIPSMKGSIIIVSFFIAGVLIGKFVNVPSLLTAEEPTLYALYALMFFVGISIGSLKASEFQNYFGSIGNNHWNFSRLRFNQCYLKRQKPNRLPSRRFWIRILFSLNYFYHSIQRCRTRYNRPRFQYSPGIDRSVSSPPTCTLLWKTCSYFSGRSHHSRHHTSYYHKILWKRICNYIHRSRNYGRFKCPVSRNIFLHGINSQQNIPLQNNILTAGHQKCYH